MRLLLSLLMLLGLLMSVSKVSSTSPSPNQTMLENINSVPSLSMLAKGLNHSFHRNIAGLLNTCSADNTTFTFFAPSDTAILHEVQKIDHLLQRSGYPSLEEIKKNVSRALNESLMQQQHNEINEQLDSPFYDEDIFDFYLFQSAAHLEALALADTCNPWWNRTSSAFDAYSLQDSFTSFSSSQEYPSLGRIPPGMNITEVLMNYAKADLEYHLVNGSQLSAGFEAHQFIPSLLWNCSQFVALNGDHQRVHVENLTKEMEMRGSRRFYEDRSSGYSLRSTFSRFFQTTNLDSIPIPMNVSLEEHITPLVLLFGPAADPLSQDMIDAILHNSSTRNSGRGCYVADTVVPDIVSSNGVIHVIDRVLEVPMNLSFVLYKANLTSCLTALNESGLLQEIESMQNITVFAPTNQAIEEFMGSRGGGGGGGAGGREKQFGESTSSSLSREELRTIIMNHIVQGAYYPPDFQSSMDLQLVNGSGTLNLTKKSMHEVCVNDSKLVTMGTLLRNGVMHGVNRVLAPANVTGRRGAPVPVAPLPPGAAHPNVSKEVSCNATSTAILPPFPTSTVNASKLGCPATDRVCMTIDFTWMECATQKHLMSTRDRAKCPQNATGYTLTNGTTFVPPIAITPRCYSPDTHVCVNNYFLCPVSAPAMCGVQCYSPDEYSCFTTFSLCPAATPQKCGEACYHPSNYTCENGTLISMGGEGGGAGGGGGGNETAPGPVGEGEQWQQRSLTVMPSCSAAGTKYSHEDASTYSVLRSRPLNAPQQGEGRGGGCDL